MLPALIGQFVVVLKDSALGTSSPTPSCSTGRRTLGSAIANIVPAYLVAAVLFICINFALTLLARKVQQQLSRRGRSLPSATAAPALGVTTGAIGTDTD